VSFRKKIERRMNMDKTRIKILVIGFIIIIAIITLGGAGYLEFYTTEVNTVSVKNLFVDVDGDGDLDLLVSGEVVVNDPPFETAQAP